MLMKLTIGNFDFIYNLARRAINNVTTIKCDNIKDVSTTRQRLGIVLRAYIIQHKDNIT